MKMSRTIEDKARKLDKLRMGRLVSYFMNTLILDRADITPIERKKNDDLKLATEQVISHKTLDYRIGMHNILVENLRNYIDSEEFNRAAEWAGYVNAFDSKFLPEFKNEC